MENSNRYTKEDFCKLLEEPEVNSRLRTALCDRRKNGYYQAEYFIKKLNKYKLPYFGIKNVFNSLYGKKETIRLLTFIYAKPLEDMPLFLNCAPFLIVKGLAQWRLKLGK